MNNWVKSEVKAGQIEPLCKKYGISQLLASIFVRRGITKGQDILYFLENDLRFQHNPFLFNSMEDAVERITQAEEEGEKILIFGDRDVDGITSTVILYDYLKSRGNDVRCRIPLESEAYGLSKKAIEEFAAEEGTLIITVDCGISNFDEIEYAAELGIDVIVTDHHNAPEQLPGAVVILDAKAPDSGYPFVDISGAAVTYKLVSALRFSHTEFYNSEICLLEVEENEEEKETSIKCIKIRNLLKIKELEEKIIPGKSSIYDLKLPYFLQGQVIYAWNAELTKRKLFELFGSGIEFNIYDLQSQVTKLIPALKNKSSQEIKASSLIAKYSDQPLSILDSLFNLYVTWCKMLIYSNNKNYAQNERKDLQLTALAAIADIMPLKNENRIFVRAGISSIQNDGPRPGLAELFAQLKINTPVLTSTDISWTLTPALNAPGRLGQADIALKLLLSEKADERNKLALEIYKLNEKRKEYVNLAEYKTKDKAIENIEKNGGKLCVIDDESIHPGITGNIAGKIMQEKNIPAITVTKSEDIYKGSMRSCRGFITTDFLSSFGDFFLNYGGHNAAAGFSFSEEKLPLFYKKIEELLPAINLEEENLDINVDAEIPPDYLTPETFDILEKMEPFGAENKELILMTRKIKLSEVHVQGKKPPYSLKLVFECGKYKFPAMFFGQAERYKKDIIEGQSYDILYTLVKNYFNGTITPQLKIKEVRKA